MPQFKYQALQRQDGKRVSGVLEAASEQQVLAQLRADALMPVSIQPDDGRGAAVSAATGRLLAARAQRLGRKELLDFVRDLRNLVRAGIALYRAFDILCESAPPGPRRAVSLDLRDRLREGSDLATAMEDSRAGFPGVVISMVRMGEASGALALALDRLLVQLQRSHALRETVVSAMIYPAILLVVAVLCVLILLAYVVPQFEDLFADMGQALPVPTQIVIAAGDFVVNWWWLGLLLCIGTIVLGRILLAVPAIRRRVDGWLLRWPLIGPLQLRLAVVHFSSTLATLLHSGMSLMPALQVVVHTTGNLALRARLQQVAGQLREGESLSGVLAEHQLFPPLVLQFLRVGEETGSLDNMLEQIAEVQSQEAEAMVKRMVALVEPLMILTLGVLIAGIIMSVLLAILSVNEFV